MDLKRNEKFIIFLISITSLGIVAESLILKWEFWVPPLIVIVVILLWAMVIMRKPDIATRRAIYLTVTLLIMFYHGVHQTGFFDVAITVVAAMTAFSFFDRKIAEHLIFAEYFVIMAIQFALAARHDGIVWDSLNISRLILQLVLIVLIYLSCLRLIENRSVEAESVKEKDLRIESYDADMEDFLTNISHELRTPVNVVNGMSDLLLKKNAASEVYSIKDAGIRLAYQIEDIQDYTECKREKLILEEEDYMCSSLINDIVTSFRLLDESRNLELVVDLSPDVPELMKGDIRKLHKIFRHLLENAVKFTKDGGIYVKLYSEKKDYGANLCIEMTDTGIGMDRKARQSVTEGMYQVNKKRNRSSGGIGLGLFIVYGFAHRMGGFVAIESAKRDGTMVRVTLPQKVVNERPCLRLSRGIEGDILFHVRSDKYKVPKVRDFYRAMAANLATAINVPLYPAETVEDIEKLKERLNVKYIFMGEEEYAANSAYFDELAKNDIVVAVSAGAGFKVNPGSHVMIMPKPLYAYPVIKILNEGRDARNIEFAENVMKPVFPQVKALVVDDEPMNLVVATGVFEDYEMITETAGSGKEAISKFISNEYDIIFMDHMMPEMDGVEAMKQIKKSASELDRQIVIVALTANVVSGAKEMFIKEGFDGFIAKPIDRADFERVLLRVLPGRAKDRGGDI